MSAVMLPPIFGDISSLYRPAAPSPLSSSPMRASSPPLSPRDPNTLPRREALSSPIRAPKFKFASRPTKVSPIVQRRDVAQENRRKQFLKNVRQRADDRAWERRGGDQELLKLEWFSMNQEYRQSKKADLQGLVSEAEIDDAGELEQQSSQMRGESTTSTPQYNPDEMMVDAITREEEAELDELITFMSTGPSSNPSTQPSMQPSRPDSPHWSDDEDYDALFMDLMSSEDTRRCGSTDDMEVS